MRGGPKEAGLESVNRRTEIGLGMVDQSESALGDEALAVKGKLCKSGDCALKANSLTRGDLASRLKGRRHRRRSEKSAEAVLAAQAVKGQTLGRVETNER